MDKDDNLIRCGCCGADSAQAIMSVADHRGLKTRVAGCPTCFALTPVYPSSGPEDVLARQIAFHEEYWRAETDLDLRTVAEQSGGLVRHYKKHLPPGSLVYDLGSGRGNLLSALNAGGYDAYGCEPSDALAGRARSMFGLPPERLSTLPMSEFLAGRDGDRGRVAAVFLWHVLEHILNPVEILREIRRFLTPDGVIICQGPLLASGYIYPEHRYLHTEANVAWMAQQADLKLITLETLSLERFAAFTFSLPDSAEQACNVAMPNTIIELNGTVVANFEVALSQAAEHLRYWMARSP